MNATKQKYYFDEPEGSEWFTRFDVLALPADHRKILNRQPVIRFIKLYKGAIIVFMPLNIKAMSN
jgi:hypothetical protein